MRIELIHKANNLKYKLNSLISNISDDTSEEEFLKKWKEYIPTEKPVFAIGGDGSVNKRGYLGFNLFAVSGYAYGQNSEGLHFEETVAEVGISVIKRSDTTDSYFRFLMFLTELKAIIKLAKKEKPKLIILDGTLTSRFIIPAPKTNWFIKKEFSGELANLSGELIEQLIPILYDFDICAFSDEIEEKAIHLIKNNLKEKPKRDIIEAVLSKVAYFEYFLLLYDLFYSFDWKPIIIGVAKTSNDTQLFEKSIPDIRILHKFVKKYNTGYTLPVYVDIATKAKAKTQEWEFSEVFQKKLPDVANKLKEISIQYFYAKYGIGSTISLIESYENPDVEEINIEEILDYLKFLATPSYPYYLIKADKEVRITHKDMDMLEKVLGLEKELKGREELL